MGTPEQSSGTGRTNGTNGSKMGNLPEWVKALFTNNPALMLLVVAILWVDGRIQNPEEKRQYLMPFEIRIKALETKIQKIEGQIEMHKDLGGHLEMDLRMKSVEKWIESSEKEK